jgi:glycerol-3-phosphate cytidylyltransferase
MKIGFTCSTFDLFHAGHIMMLKEAKKQCDYLIVGLQTDPTIDRPQKNKPVQGVFERYVQLEACKYVDEVVPYATEKELLDILLSYPINVRIVGDEYQNQEFTGKAECWTHDIEIYYNRREHSFSTSELRQRVVAAEINKGIRNESK